MALTERLAILIDANGAQAVSEFKKVGDAANRSLGAVESRSAKLGATMQTVGAGAVGLGAALTVGLTKAAGKFSDLEQASGAVESVFGAAAATIEEFGASSATSVGLSEAAFKQLTATVGALLQGFGYTQDEAAATSIQIAKLGADLSAAFGGTTEEAITAIGAALRGERDPIERYGAAFNEAAVQAKIAALGLDTSTAAAEQNAKAQAALAIIMERTANVSGQFGRESDTLAHKQQVAAAEAENAAAKLGAGFAPVLEKVTGLLTDAATGFAALDDATGGGLSTFTAYATVALTVGGALTTVVGKVVALRAAHQASAIAAAEAAVAEGAVATANVAVGTTATVAAAAMTKLSLALAVAAAGYAAYQNIKNGAGDDTLTADAEETQRILHATADDLEAIASELGQTRSLDFFESLLSQSEPAARKFLEGVRAAGFATEDFQALLKDTSSVEQQARYYSALSAFYRENATEAENLTTSTAGLKNMLDQIGSKFESNFAALDASAAFEAVYKAQTKATGSSRDYRAEQHQLEQSTKAVTEAQEDLADAELALFLARQGPSARDKVDAELDRAEAALSLRDAQNEVADAQRALNDARKEGEPEDVRDATRDLERANLNLRRSQLANDDAQKAYNDTLNSGAESSDAVKAANEKLTEAQERLEEAQFQAEETQRRLNEGTAVAAGAVEDYGAKAGAAAEEQWKYVQSLIDAGAPQSVINEALRIATGRVSDLESDFGNLNPKLAIYLQLLKEIANFEDANEVAFATSAGGKNIVIRKKDVPGYKAPYDLSAPAMGSGMSTSSMTAGGGNSTIIVQLDGKPITQAVVDHSQLTGGVPIVIRNPN